MTDEIEKALKEKEEAEDGVLEQYIWSSDKDKQCLDEAIAEAKEKFKLAEIKYDKLKGCNV